MVQYSKSQKPYSLPLMLRHEPKSQKILALNQPEIVIFNEIFAFVFTQRQ